MPDEPEPQRDPNQTQTFRGKMSYAEMELARNVAGLQTQENRRDTPSAPKVVREAVVYYAQHEYPEAYRKYLVATKGRVSRAG